MRNVLPIFLLIAVSAPARAQDMPLSQVLIEGEGWREVKGEPPLPRTSGEATIPGGRTYRIQADGVCVIESGSSGPGRRLSLAGPVKPAGLVLWPDGGTLVVGDAEGKHLWAYRVEKDGSLSNGDRYYALRVRPGQMATGVTALTMDAAGRLYAATPLGVQIFDPTGRMSGVLLRPADGPLTALAFGGDKGDTLFVVCGDRTYARRTQAKGLARK